MEKEFKITESLLNDIISEIEAYEYQIEGEWGYCRSIKELVESNDMPESYYKLIAIRDANETRSTKVYRG